MFTGTLVNALAILIGSTCGLAIKSLAKHTTSLGLSADLGARLQERIMQGMALCVMYIGISGTLQGQNTLITIFSMVIGTIIGEVLNLHQRMEWLGARLEQALLRFTTQGESSIGEGFVTATLLYCVGAMAIVGSLQSGISGDHATLFAKSTLDGITSVVLSCSLGLGVLFSAVAVFIYQGAITALSAFIAPYLGDVVVAEMTCVGSLLIVALSLNMLGITKIKVMNLVPACLAPIVLCLFM